MFPAGAVAYNGEVKVYARYLNPDDARLRLYMPGDLRGINAGGSEQTLATFGMMAVELRGQAGEELQLAPDQAAELSMRVPAGKSSVAPPEIPLWHYDLDQARWIEEGSAQKVGSRYVGKVKHFSFWNCDLGMPLIRLDGQVVVGPYSTPLTEATVQLTILSKGYQRWATTDQNGQFGGAVPMDETMQLDVYIPSICGYSPVFSQTIGPFSTDATLPPIQVILPTELASTEVTGRVIDCAQQPVANGYAMLETPSGTFIGFTDGNGVFNISIINCFSSTQTGFATGYNITDPKQSDSQSFSLPATTVALNDLVTCQNIEEFIQYDLDGESFLVPEPKGYLFVDNFASIDAGDTISNPGAIYFMFQCPNQIGTFPIIDFWIKKYSGSIGSMQINTTITEFGTPGQHIAGSFSGTFMTGFNGANTHTISGTFRAKRQ